MSIKLNSFILSDNTIREMENLSQIAGIVKNEHGFNLCLNENNKVIRPGKVCEGEECSMNISEFRCEQNERPVGVFHTHRKLSRPSMPDLDVGYLVGTNCIGSPEEIKCFTRKKDFDALAFADIKDVRSKEEETQ